MGSRWPKRPHDGNKSLQHDHKEAPGAPEMALGAFKMALRNLKMVPRWLQKAPTWPKETPNEVQNDLTKQNRAFAKKPLFLLRFSMKMTFGEVQNGINFDGFSQLD